MAVGNSLAQSSQKQSVNAMLNALLDQEGMRKRFDELMGKRSAQFISSIISLINADEKLQQAFRESPKSVVQSALKAATFDLPIDPNLGYAYIVPFKKNVTLPDGKEGKRTEASFIMGYKGMHQLALRTGAYKTINVLDVREGELVRYDRLTEESEFCWIEDEEERESKPVVGYVGYFKLLNGTEKTIYMTVKQIEAHEEKNRKGKYMGKGWREDFNAMALKTVYRRLIGKWGVMSIDYHTADDHTLALADAVATGSFDGEQPEIVVDFDDVTEVTDGSENEEIPFAPDPPDDFFDEP